MTNRTMRAAWLLLLLVMWAGAALRAEEARVFRPDQRTVAADARRMVETREHRAAVKRLRVDAPFVARTTKEPTTGGALAAVPDVLSGNANSPWSVVVGLTLLTLLPALLLAMTPMVRLLVIFHFLRQALGTQTAPSNQILMGLALMMTWFLMAPVLTQVEQQAVTPYRQGTLTGAVAIERGIAPVKTYMLRYAREKDLVVFAAAGMANAPLQRTDLPFQVVVPAYMLSELKAGFAIGAMLFLPFLLVDLVVASITTSIGMLQLPPVVISTPVKILLFVMVDGWNLLADKLLKSF